ncbi:MAG: excinuclease ABC subunit UvrA, partial [Pseudomonadota bacterium]
MREPRDLILRGARAHNLRGLDVRFPHGALCAVTGVSGSGKSSLAVDCLLLEARRRYLGAAAGPALQRLGRLGRAEIEGAEGLRAGVLLGQAPPAGGSRSTVGTLSGLLDLLRLLLARVGTRPCPACGARLDRHPTCPACGAAAPPLTAGSLSFNRPQGACPACQGLGLQDQVDPALLVAHPERGLRQGALVPTTPKPYIVYSQVTMEVLDQVCRAHGFTVDTPWRELTDEQRAVVFHGSERLEVPFGKHPLESRMRWSGITARPREEGHYKGIVTTIEGILAAGRRNPGVLRFVRSLPCAACCGTRLAPAARAVTLGGRGLPGWTASP